MVDDDELDELEESEPDELLLDDDPSAPDSEPELVVPSVPLLPVPTMPATQNPSTPLHDSPAQHDASSMHHRTRSSCPTHMSTHAAGPRCEAPAS